MAKTVVSAVQQLNGRDIAQDLQDAKAYIQVRPSPPFGHLT